MSLTTFAGRDCKGGESNCHGNIIFVVFAYPPCCRETLSSRSPSFAASAANPSPPGVGNISKISLFFCSFQMRGLLNSWKQGGIHGSMPSAHWFSDQTLTNYSGNCPRIGNTKIWRLASVVSGRTENGSKTQSLMFALSF